MPQLNFFSFFFFFLQIFRSPCVHFRMRRVHGYIASVGHALCPPSGDRDRLSFRHKSL